MSVKIRHLIFSGTVAVMFLLSLACAIGGTPSSQVQPSPSEPTVPVSLPPQTVEIGEVVRSGDLALVVLGWENLPPGDYYHPEAGKKFIAVEFMIVNAGQAPSPIDGYSDLYLKDETGMKYDYSIEASNSADIASIGLELNPGEKVWGKSGFQVPENVAGLQCIFDSDDWNAGKIFVNLGPQPVSVQPPAALPGEKPQQSNGVGETIQIGSLAVVVSNVTYSPDVQFSSPRPGYKFVAVEVTIENKGQDTVEIFSFGMMSLKDSRGWFYEEDIGLTSDLGGELDVQLTPGEKIRGLVGFQVPIDVSGLVFLFDDDTYTPGRVSIALP